MKYENFLKYLVANRHVNIKSFKKNNCVRRNLVLSSCFMRLYNNGFKSFTWNRGSDIIWSNSLYEKFDTGYLYKIRNIMVRIMVHIFLKNQSSIY